MRSGIRWTRRGQKVEEPTDESSKNPDEAYIQVKSNEAHDSGLPPTARTWKLHRNVIAIACAPDMVRVIPDANSDPNLAFRTAHTRKCISTKKNFWNRLFRKLIMDPKLTSRTIHSGSIFFVEIHF